MEIKNITKEQLFALWTKTCENANVSEFGHETEIFQIDSQNMDEPSFILEVKSTPDIHLMVTPMVASRDTLGNPTFYNYFINVVFEESISYMQIEISEEEYKNLTETFEKHQIRTRSELKNRIVEDCENVLMGFVGLL